MILPCKFDQTETNNHVPTALSTSKKKEKKEI